MVKLELKKEINSSAKKVYDILNDDSLETFWNITVNETEEIEPDKYFVKTTVGDVTSTVIERVENEKISYSIEGGIFSSMGYILNQKGDILEVTGWAEFEDEDQRKILEKAGGVLLDSLKVFAEYLEDGGNPDEFDKKEILVSP